MAPGVLYVHGAFVRDGAWWWQPVADLLAANDVPSHTVDLPSCGEAAPLGGLAEDAAAVRQKITEIGTPLVVVAHSYGGMAVTEAAGLPTVRHLLYLAAIVPDHQSVLTSGWVPEDGAVASSVDFREDGTIGEHAEQFVGRLLPDCTAEVREQAMARITRQNGAAYGVETTTAAWRDIPSTYGICLRDGDVPVQIQQLQASRTKSVVEFETNHFPHLERPELVADLVMSLVRAENG